MKNKSAHKKSKKVKKQFMPNTLFFIEDKKGRVKELFTSRQIKKYFTVAVGWEQVKKAMRRIKHE